MEMRKFTWVECPRDAMQGISHFIPTQDKVTYINQLIAVGFEVIDIGSFVSPKAIPQLSDSSEVINAVEWGNKKPDFLVIVANEKGAENACKEQRVDTLGFPFSISETFQMRNTGATQEISLKRLDEIYLMSQSAHKKMVIYLSMAFGNPYGEKYDENMVLEWCQNLSTRYPQSVFSLSDTIGAAHPDQIQLLYQTAIEKFPDIEIGLHLHATPQDAMAKAKAAIQSGCTRLDSAIGGFGGCPMATNDLTGNLDSNVVRLLIGEHSDYNWEAFDQAKSMSNKIFHAS